MLLTYIGPHDAVEVEGLGVVNRGEDVEVDKRLAGRGPSTTTEPRRLAALRDVVRAEADTDLTDDEVERRAYAELTPEDLDDLVDFIDLGEGLLAQTDNWQPAAGLESLGKAELEAIAEQRGVDLTGAKTKAQIVERLEAADSDTTQEV